MRRRINAARVAGARIPFARYAGSFLARPPPTAEAVGYFLRPATRDGYPHDTHFRGTVLLDKSNEAVEGYERLTRTPKSPLPGAFWRAVRRRQTSRADAASCVTSGVARESRQYHAIGGGLRNGDL
jgi:hypothetical protein